MCLRLRLAEGIRQQNLLRSLPLRLPRAGVLKKRALLASRHGEEGKDEMRDIATEKR